MQAKYTRSTPVMAERFDGSAAMAKKWGMCHQLGDSDSNWWYWNREEFEPVPAGNWLIHEFNYHYDVSDEFFREFFHSAN